MKVGVPTRFKFMFFGVKGYDRLMKTFNHLTAFDKSKIAKLRLEAIEFYSRFGLAATLSAYKVSKATFYRWRKKYLDQQKKVTALIPKSTKPKRVRQRLVDLRIIEYIKKLRLSYGRLGKDKLKPLVDEHCTKQGIPRISASTIGRVISDNKCFYQKAGRMYHNPSHKWAKQRKRIKRQRQKYAPKPNSFGHIEMDTLVKFIDGMKVYLITAIDVKLKFSFAQAYTRLNSKNALDCFEKLQLVYPFSIHTVQTDNGLEFQGELDNYLKKKQIKHLFTYPRCPRINGVVERFNRTLKEDFLNSNLHLVSRPKLFHRKLMNYLLFFNTKRPHQSLGQRSPLGYALEEGYLSQMYWTSTKGCKNNLKSLR
jgi:putative transposase